MREAVEEESAVAASSAEGMAAAAAEAAPKRRAKAGEEATSAAAAAPAALPVLQTPRVVVSTLAPVVSGYMRALLEAWSRGLSGGHPHAPVPWYAPLVPWAPSFGNGTAVEDASDDIFAGDNRLQHLCIQVGGGPGVTGLRAGRALGGCLRTCGNPACCGASSAPAGPVLLAPAPVNQLRTLPACPPASASASGPAGQHRPRAPQLRRRLCRRRAPRRAGRPGHPQRVAAAGGDLEGGRPGGPPPPQALCHRGGKPGLPGGPVLLVLALALQAPPHWEGLQWWREGVSGGCGWSTLSASPSRRPLPPATPATFPTLIPSSAGPAHSRPL